MAGTGPRPMSSGSTPAYAKDTSRSRGSRPSSATARFEARSAAVAPSVSPAELPAVTRPAARKGVDRAASPSSVVSGRRNSSRSAIAQPVSVKTDIGTTVSAMTPSAQAAVARCCERSAYCVGHLARQLGEAVVEVLRCLAHHGGALVDDALGEEARVEVDLRAHDVMAHVLDAAHEDDVRGAHCDLTRAGRDRSQRTGAHAVDSEAGHGLRQPGEQRHVAPEGQSLVADLSGRGHDDVVDALGRQGPDCAAAARGRP